MLIAQQHLVGKAAPLRMDQRNLPPPLINQIMTGGFRGEGVIKLNTVLAIAFQTINQHHIGALDLQRKARADDQHVIAQATGEFIQRA